VSEDLSHCSDILIAFQQQLRSEPIRSPREFSGKQCVTSKASGKLPAIQVPRSHYKRDLIPRHFLSIVSWFSYASGAIEPITMVRIGDQLRHAGEIRFRIDSAQRRCLDRVSSGNVCSRQ
jgi:hypothetical protein